MFSKALWMKHFKQGKFAIWGLFLSSLLIPYKFYSVEQQYQDHKAAVLRGEPVYGEFYSHPNYFDNGIMFIMLFTIVLAALLVGMQRSNQHMDFLYSLPIKRRDIYLNQWMIGAVTILGSLVISLGLALILLLNSEYIITQIKPFVLFNHLLFLFITLLAMYSFCLMVGMFTGSIISHLGLSFIGLLLPTGFFMLFRGFLHVHSQFSPSLWKVNEYVELITLPLSILNNSYSIAHLSHVSRELYAAIPILLISFIIGLIFSKFSKAEHHGKLILYPALEPVLKFGVVICFFLLGGAFFSDIGSTANIGSYYLGGIVFGVISYLVLRKLLNTRFQLGKQG